MRTTSKHSQYIVGKLAVLTLFCLSLLLVSGCGNQARIETAKSDFLAYSNFVAEGNGANLKDFLESKKDNFKVWQKTAGKKIPEGEVILGLAHFYGVGTRENKSEAIKWFRKAAEQGFAEGQYQLGKAYFLGEGIEQDQPEGVKWLYKAKEQAHTEADALFQITKISPRVRTVPVVYRAAEEDGEAESTARQQSRTAMPPIVNNAAVSAAPPFIDLKEEHTSSLHLAAFSPDGKKIVTTNMGNTARIWDTEAGKELQKLEGHTGDVQSVAFSPDGKKIVTSSESDLDGSTARVRIWDAETGKELQKLVAEWRGVAAPSVAFSPDGKKIVTGLDAARIWDAETGKELHKLEGHTGWVNSVAFSPDGKQIVTGSNDKTARIWDVETGKELQKLEGHTGLVQSVVFSPDGKKIATTGSFDAARIWDAETGKELHKLEGHTGMVQSAAFSPNGKKIVTASNDTAHIWDAETGKKLQKLEGHTNFIHSDSAAFSPDSKKIVTGSSDKTARIWDAESGKELQKFEGGFRGYFSPDGKKIAVAGNVVRIWNLTATGEATDNMPKEIRDLHARVDRGDAEAMFQLFRRYLDGDGVPKNFDMAEGLILRAAEGGHPGATMIVRLAGAEARNDASAEVRDLHAKAKCLDSEALALLGLRYLVGEGVPQDTELGGLMVLMSAGMGNTRAKLALQLAGIEVDE